MKAAILVVLLALLEIQPGSGAASPSCSLPPFKWCSSLATAVQCGVRTATFANVLSYTALPLKRRLVSNRKCVRC